MGNLLKEEKLTPRYEGLKVTREEYLDLYDDGFKYDMVEGVLHMSPSPFYEHGKVQNKFGHLIQTYLDKSPIGEVVTEVDVLLPDGQDVFRPDITFILNENLHIVKKHIHGSPDLICEILSDSTRARDLGVKADRYLKNGVKEYWIIDPDNKTSELWVNNQTNWIKSDEDSLESNLLKGFKIKVNEVFT